MTPRKLLIAAAAAIALLGPNALRADLNKAERKEARKLFSGRLYLRIDAPCTQGRHPFGVFYSPLVDVSPKGVNTEAESGASFGWYHASSTVWAVRVNDPVELDALEWGDDGTVEIELTGVGSADGRDTNIRFVDLNSFADFEAAFKLAFATQPLQDEHPDWPAEIRKAIADRRLVQGMTKRQVYYVVGMPAAVDKATEDGKEIETWTLHKKGMEIGFFSIDPGDPSAPAEKVRFEDGKLTTSSTRNPSKLDLDQ